MSCWQCDCCDCSCEDCDPNGALADVPEMPEQEVEFVKARLDANESVLVFEGVECVGIGPVDVVGWSRQPVDGGFWKAVRLARPGARRRGVGGFFASASGGSAEQASLDFPVRGRIGF